MPEKKWFLVDIDHTLVETEQFQFQARSETVDTFSDHVMTEDEYIINYCGRSTFQNAQDLVYALHIKTPVEDVFAFRQQRIQEIIGQQKYFNLMEGAEVFAKYIVENKIPTVLVTWGGQQESIAKLQKSALLDVFKDSNLPLISEERYTKGKPDPEAYILGKKLLSALFEKQNMCVEVFEDTSAGMLSGLAAWVDIVNIIPHKRSQYWFDLITNKDHRVRTLTSLLAYEWLVS